MHDTLVISHIRNAWPEREGRNLFQSVQTEVAWRQDYLRMFGKRIPLPRLTAWYGDPGTGYKYSGIVNEPIPWTPLLEQIRGTVQELTRCEYNSVLLNYYRSGSDHVSWHADDESAIDPRSGIASVSFGAARRFQFRHRHDSQMRRDLWLENGDLLHMQPPTQQYWQHRLPKERNAGGRINLTFRHVAGS